MSPVHVILSLILLTFVSLGAGCRAFSADSKDGVSVSGSRPLSYQNNASAEVDKKDDVNAKVPAVEKSGSDPVPASAAVFDDAAGRMGREEFEAGQKSWDAAVKASGKEEASLKFAEAEKHYWNALNKFPFEIKYVNAWRRAAFKCFSPEDCEKKIAALADEYHDSVPLAILYGRILAMSRKFDMAIRHLEGTLELNIDSQELAREIIVISFQAGKYSKVMELYKWLTDNGLLTPTIAVTVGRWWNELGRKIASGNGINIPGGSALSQELCTKEKKSASRDAFELVLVAAAKNDQNNGLLNVMLVGQYLAEVLEKELLLKLFEKMDNFHGIGDRVIYVMMKMESLAAVNDMEGALKAAAVLEDCSEKLNLEMFEKIIMVLMRGGQYARGARIHEKYISMIGDPSAAVIDRLVLFYYNAGEYKNVILSLQMYEKPTGVSRFIAGHSYRALGNEKAAYREYKLGEESLQGTRGIDSYHYLGYAQSCLVLGKVDEALQKGEKAWNGNRDDHRFCNFYGYILADAGQKLDLARKLIEKALKAQPDNVAYLDSMAWVLFRQGDFAGAEEFMRRIMKIGVGDNEEVFEIFDHFGDILFANGKKEEAREFWNKALAKAKDPGVRRKLEKKLSE